MTLASVVAVRSDAANFIISFSDSRLTLQGALSYSDYAIKGVGLGPRSALFMAGQTTIPIVAAAECARGLIVNANALKRERGEADVSLLVEAKHFCEAFKACAFPFDGSPLQMQVVLAGFFCDQVPGLVKVEYGPTGRTVKVFRPNPNAFVAVSIGQSSVTGVATRSICNALADAKNVLEAKQRVASVFWEMINDPVLEGIGGGLAVGFCLRGHSVWQWPMVRIGDRAYYRGVPIDEIPDGWDASSFTFWPDATPFITAERDDEATSLGPDWPAPLNSIDEEWAITITDEEARLLGFERADL